MYLSHNITFPAFITRFHKNDMKLQNSFITIQIKKVRRSTIRSSNLKKTTSRPLKLLAMAIKDITLSQSWVQEDFYVFYKVTISVTESSSFKPRRYRRRHNGIDDVKQ